MMRLSFLLVSIAMSFCSAAPFPGRIVGGTEVSIVDYPYQAALERIGIDVCGGTIISTNRVLTAAHCINNHNDFVVRCGTDTHKGGQVIEVTDVKLHPQYNPNDYDNDAAVLFLVVSIAVTDRTAVIPLARDTVGGNRTAWVSGWGNLTENRKRPKQLHAAEVVEYSQEECRRDYSRFRITRNMICFGGRDASKDACQGDSGGPLADRTAYELVGITSWGWGCARQNKPGVYVHVAFLHDWIESQL